MSSKDWLAIGSAKGSAKKDIAIQLRKFVIKEAVDHSHSIVQFAITN